MTVGTLSLFISIMIEYINWFNRYPNKMWVDFLDKHTNPIYYAKSAIIVILLDFLYDYTSYAQAVLYYHDSIRKFFL